MSVLDESYNNLKTLAIRRSFEGHGVDISSLAKVYKDIIKSPRVVSCIADVKSLIEVLEKRSALNPSNIDMLDFIYKALELDLELLTKHSTLIERVGKQNTAFTRPYQNKIENHSQFSTPVEHRFNNLGVNIPSSEQSSVTSSVNSSHGGVLSDRVTDMVCSQIGHSWKNLARYLKVVQECTIDKIEEDENLKTNEARARMMIFEFQRKTDDADVKPRLLKALRLASRMDIHDQVQKQLFRESSSEKIRHEEKNSNKTSFKESIIAHKEKRKSSKIGDNSQTKKAVYKLMYKKLRFLYRKIGIYIVKVGLVMYNFFKECFKLMYFLIGYIYTALKPFAIKVITLGSKALKSLFRSVAMSIRQVSLLSARKKNNNKFSKKVDYRSRKRVENKNSSPQQRNNINLTNNCYSQRVQQPEGIQMTNQSHKRNSWNYQKVHQRRNIQKPNQLPMKNQIHKSYFREQFLRYRNEVSNRYCGSDSILNPFNEN